MAVATISEVQQKPVPTSRIISSTPGRWPSPPSLRYSKNRFQPVDNLLYTGKMAVATISEVPKTGSDQ
jgi:hypothetical protein